MKCKFIVVTVLAIAASSSAITPTGPDRERNPKGNHHPNRNDISILKAKEREAAHTARETTQLIFDKIKAGLCVRFAHGSGKSDKSCPVVTDVIEKKVYEGYASAINIYFDAIFITQPEASSTIAKARALALTRLKALVTGLADAVALIDEYYGDEVRIKIDKIEEETVEAAANVTKFVYVPILKGHDSATSIGAKLLSVKEKTVSAIIKCFRGIFRCTRSVLANVFPDVDFRVPARYSFDTFQNSTMAGFHEVVSGVFEAGNILFNANLEKPKQTSGHPLN